MRDRVDEQGRHWVHSRMRDFLGTKLIDSNVEYDRKKKRSLRLKNIIKNFPVKVYLFITKQ